VNKGGIRTDDFLDLEVKPRRRRRRRRNKKKIMKKKEEEERGNETK
jgi:hypothetical protein